MVFNEFFFLTLNKINVHNTAYKNFHMSYECMTVFLLTAHRFFHLFILKNSEKYANAASLNILQLKVFFDSKQASYEKFIILNISVFCLTALANFSLWF